jgi:tetratricopeptide (TPR) repeat protein
MTRVLELDADLDGATDVESEISAAEERQEQERLRVEQIDHLMDEVRSLQSKGESAAALAKLGEVLELDPGRSFAIKLQGEIHEDLVQAEEEERERQESIDAAMIMAAAALESGDAEKASRRAREVLDLDPEHAEALAVMADVDKLEERARQAAKEEEERLAAEQEKALRAAEEEAARAQREEEARRAEEAKKAARLAEAKTAETVVLQPASDDGMAETIIAGPEQVQAAGMETIVVPPPSPEPPPEDTVSAPPVGAAVTEEKAPPVEEAPKPAKKAETKKPVAPQTPHRPAQSPSTGVSTKTIGIAAAAVVIVALAGWIFLGGDGDAVVDPPAGTGGVAAEPGTQEPAGAPAAQPEAGTTVPSADPLAEADRLLGLSDFEGAAAEARQVVAADPDSAAAATLLARAVDGLVDEAQALAESGDSRAAQDRLGVVDRFDAGNSRAAALRRSLTETPTAAPGAGPVNEPTPNPLEEAQRRLDQQDFAGAATAANAVLVADPANSGARDIVSRSVDGLLNQAQARVSAGDNTGAEGRLAIVDRFDPGNGRAASLRAAMAAPVAPEPEPSPATPPAPDRGPAEGLEVGYRQLMMQLRTEDPGWPAGTFTEAIRLGAEAASDLEAGRIDDAVTKYRAASTEAGAAAVGAVDDAAAGVGQARQSVAAMVDPADLTMQNAEALVQSATRAREANLFLPAIADYVQAEAQYRGLAAVMAPVARFIALFQTGEIEALEGVYPGLTETSLGDSLRLLFRDNDGISLALNTVNATITVPDQQASVVVELLQTITDRGGQNSQEARFTFQVISQGGTWIVADLNVLYQ